MRLINFQPSGKDTWNANRITPEGSIRLATITPEYIVFGAVGAHPEELTAIASFMARQTRTVAEDDIEQARR